MFFKKEDESVYCIDSHCHYDQSVFNQNRFQLLAEIKKARIDKLIVPPILAESNITMREKLDYISNPSLLDESGYTPNDLPKIFFAAGIHPSRTWKNPNVSDENKKKFILNGIKRERTVAIGETGLDFHREFFRNDFAECQRFWFEYQLSLSKEHSLPLILHIRDAFEDALDILRSSDASSGGAVHCFNEGYEEAKQYIDMGFYIGIGGSLFENSELENAVRKIPIESILLETDAPSVKPIWDTNRYNTSLNIPAIAKRISDIKNISAEAVIGQTTKNAEKLFSI